MKKKIALAMLVCMCGAALFAQKEVDETKAEQTLPESSDIKNIQLAYSLADYGWENDSATALLQAAEILSGIPTQEGKFEKKSEGASTEKSKNEAKDYSIEKLLKDARSLFGKDKTLEAWAKKIEKASKTVKRGAFGGPKYDYSYVYGSSKASYYNVGFVAGRYAEVSVYSMDGADLDLYIYDENWNLIDKDTSYSANAYCSFVPRWDGIFHIVVKNNSRYTSYYRLYTN